MKCLKYLDPDDKQKADAEITLMRKLDSKFTVHLVETILHDIQICLIVEYCAGGDLNKTIADLQRMDEKDRMIRVWQIFGQMTRALNHLHTNEVIHRDLKPGNIFMNEDGSIRLGDFGQSKDMTGKEYATYGGTKAYMAPEGHLTKRLDYPSDIFSLGIIVFQLLTGMHPFEGGSENDTIERIKRCQREQLPEFVTREMRDLVEAMLQLDPTKRPTTQKIMEQETIRVYLDVQEEKERAVDENSRIKASVLIPSSINPFSPTPVVPVGMQCHSEGTSIVHSDKNKDYCNVAYNPIITNGVMRFEGLFVNCENWT
ncbi:MAG: putative CMGC kinase, CK2 family, partial [Streblomastix strix]